MDNGPNVKCKAIKSPEENIGDNLQELGIGGEFLDIIPETWKER